MRPVSWGKFGFFLFGIGLMIYGLRFFARPNILFFVPGALIVWAVISPYLLTKMCLNCGLRVSMYAQRGERCPRCGFTWK